uniref:Meiosis-specific protein MEI4 n=3 Tax=Delphinidae TaxID=9726 RepID=A0A6J3PRG3_TURTR|nr:meiosis-specific protein MEI4 [Tursiops truncatus]
MDVELGDIRGQGGIAVARSDKMLWDREASWRRWHLNGGLSTRYLGNRGRSGDCITDETEGTKARMDGQAWYLRTSKLALALAIIHSKPADKSSREYTEHLARMVSGQESKWRAKVKALEAEVLQLRQKQLLSRICSGSFESVEAKEESSELLALALVGMVEIGNQEGRTSPGTWTRPEGATEAGPGQGSLASHIRSVPGGGHPSSHALPVPGSECHCVMQPKLGFRVTVKIKSMGECLAGMCATQPCLTSAGDPPTPAGGPSSQLQAQEPRSSENTSTLLEDSGCVLSNDQRTEPSEMTEHSGESCISTPFPPLSIVNRPCAPLEKPLSSHMQFLQRLLGLKTLTESESLKTDLSHFENASSTVSDSVFQLLDGLITFYQEPKLPCSSFWIEAVDTLARLIGDCNLSNHILKKCSKKLEEFEKTLLQVILSNSHINRFQVQHYVSQSLVTLGSCSLLRRSIISLLLSEVNSFADDLGTINQVQASYDVTRYENIFSVFCVLEQLLQKETEEGNASKMGHEDQEIKKFLQKHDETILQLSDAFPLFTFYLWRLGTLLNSVETGTVENNSLP